MRRYSYQPDLFEFPDSRFRPSYSPTPDELWASGRRNVALPEPNDYTPMVALDNPTFSGWWMTWEVTALRRLENAFEIDLGLRIA